MKIAIVHELLTMKGGAERVLRVLADMFPDAPIYTLLYDESKLGDWFPKERVHPSALQSSLTSHVSRLTSRPINHHLYLRKFPSAAETWDFSQFDVVLSSSSAFAHGIITNGKPKHLCYVHSPARYLWDRTHDVLEQAAKGMLGPLKRRYLSRAFHELRIWDTEAADRPDMLLAASKEVRRRIELYWRRESRVLYPPIDDHWFSSSNRGLRSRRDDHYLLVSSLRRYKRIDLAIDACKLLNRPLRIIGEGSDLARLKRLAGANVEFLGYQSHEQLKELYANARAALFPGEEDFGLVPLESMACGTPVIGFAKGGAPETIVPGKTGELFNEPTAQSLAEAMRRLESTSYDREALMNQAKRFDRKTFENGIRESIEAMMAVA